MNEHAEWVEISGQAVPTIFYNRIINGRVEVEASLPWPKHTVISRDVKLPFMTIVGRQITFDTNNGQAVYTIEHEDEDLDYYLCTLLSERLNS